MTKQIQLLLLSITVKTSKSKPQKWKTNLLFKTITFNAFMILFTNLILQFGNFLQKVISLLLSLSCLFFQEKMCGSQLLICHLYLHKTICRKILHISGRCGQNIWNRILCRLSHFKHKFQFSSKRHKWQQLGEHNFRITIKFQTTNLRKWNELVKLKPYTFSFSCHST